MFWLGEYAVLAGAPAVVAAVDRYAVVHATPQPGASLVVDGSTLDAPIEVRSDDGIVFDAEPPRGAELVVAVARTLAHRGLLRPDGARVTADSSALSVSAGGRKLGLGSSGAAAAGLTAALADWPADDEAGLAACAVDAHRAFQNGRGSGADVVASVFGGVTVQQQGAPVYRVELPSALRYAVIDTGASASTPELVGRVRARQSEDPEGARVMFDSLRQIAMRGVDALRRSDADAWLGSVEAYAEAERALATWSGAPIFAEPVERALRAARSCGWVAKPSGAGGGDIVIAFSRTSADPERIRQACSAASVVMLPLALSDDGAKPRPL